MDAVKPLCDRCVRMGVLNSVMVSYRALDELFDTQLGIPYHCESGRHERAYHAYDGYHHLSRRPGPAPIFADTANTVPEGTRYSFPTPNRALT
jgi:hypothetical protein